MSALQIGVLGFGRWGPNHVRAFNSMDGCVVRRVVDFSEDRLAAARRLYPQLETSTRSEDVLAADDVDAVVIATPTDTHYDVAKAALEAGKHVLCEKPLTRFAKESAELVALAEDKGLVLMVGHVFVYNPGIQHLKAEIEAGNLGRVYYMDAVRTNLGPIRTDVGAIYDLASHDISVFSYLLDADPLSVSARSATFLQNEHEDVAFITLEYPGNTICNVHVSWLNPRKVRQLTVVGSSKMAVWDDMQPLEPIRMFDKGLQDEPHYDTFGEFQMVLRDGDITIPKVKMFEPVATECRHFAECVIEGVPCRSDGRAGQSVVHVLESALKSMKAGGAVVDLTS